MELPDKVIEALIKGKKIDAITLLRKERSIGLKEAKEIVEAYQRHQEINPPDTAQSGAPILPDVVMDAMMNGRKIKAIKLLRSMKGLGLAEAKARVEAFQAEQRSLRRSVNRAEGDRKQGRAKNMLFTAAVIASFVWAMVNIVNVAASVIVLINKDGYKKTVFTIEKLYYRDDSEDGLSWGFTGRLPDRNERLYAPGLADAKALKYGGLRSMFPPGTKVDVWYNAKVTGTLFQHRTINVIPYTRDLTASEMEHIIWWVKFCLFPFAVILILAHNLREPQQRGRSEARM